MKKILVPTDFSKEADNALEAAAVIARKTGAVIELLHVIEDLPHDSFSASGTYIPANSMDKLFVIKLIEKAHEQLHTRMHHENFKGLTVIHEVKVGNMFKHVGQSIADEKVDLIVMGTKGASGLQEVLVGSNAEKVVRFAKCPVLTVHENTGSFTLKNVVLAVSFEDTYTAFMNNLKEMQKLFDFTLHILHVNTPLNFDTTYAIEEKIQKLSKKYQLQNYTFSIINEYSNEAGIIRFTEKNMADMIVMLTHARKGLSYFLDGSVTSQVVNHARKPIMSYKLIN